MAAMMTTSRLGAPVCVRSCCRPVAGSFTPMHRRATGNTRSRMQVTAANTFSVRVFNEAEGLDATFEVDEDEYILDAADGHDVELPNSCRSGSCGTCAGKIVEGQVDQSELCGGLDEDQIAAGYVLPCVAYPRSNLIIETHQEQELY